MAIDLQGVDATTAVGSIMIGLGIMPGADKLVFENMVISCVGSLTDLGFVKDGLVDCVRMLTDWSEAAYGLTEDLIQAVRSWALNAGMVSQKLENTMISSSAGFGIKFGATEADFKLWGKSLYVQSLAQTSGGFMVLGKYGGDIAGLVTCTRTHSGVTVDYVNWVYTKSLAPYVGSTVPVGSFVSDFTSSFLRVDDYAGAYLTFEDAYAAYQAGVRTDLYYLTPRSYVGIYKYGSNSYGGLCNLGYIKSTGEVIEGYSHNGWLDTFAVPSAFESAEVVTSTVADGLTAGVIGDLTADVSVAYPGWASGAISVPGVDVGVENKEETLIYPWFPGLTWDDVISQSQTDIWEGTKTETDTDTDSGTASDSITDSVGKISASTFLEALKDALLGPLEWLGDMLLNGIKALFVPAEGFIEGKFQDLASRFGLAKVIYDMGAGVSNFINDLGSKPPVIYIDLGESRGSYELGGKVVFVDLTWYAEYKPTVDLILSAFIWLWFIWRMLLSLPGIISGTAGMWREPTSDPALFVGPVLDVRPELGPGQEGGRKI